MSAPVDEPGGREEPDTRRLTWVRRLVWVVLVAGVVAFLVQGADNPPDPVLGPEETGAESASGPAPGSPPATSGSAGAPSTTAGPPDIATTAPAAAPGPRTSTEPAPPPDAPPTSAARPTPPPAPSTTVPAPAGRRPLPGFGEVTFRIAHPAGGAVDGMALLADDGTSRGQGLMEQTDLRGYDAMIFRFPRADNYGFFMRNTLIPLSIAFFDANGHFVSSADMEPCPDEVEDCPTTAADGPYVHAIEVAQGDLPRLGIGPGAVLSFP